MQEKVTCLQKAIELMEERKSKETKLIETNIRIDLTLEKQVFCKTD